MSIYRERQHPAISVQTTSFRIGLENALHGCASIIAHGGKLCRMELAISVERYVAEVTAAKQDLAAERKLVACIEQLVMSTDFTAAVNSMLQTIIEHYDADRAYIFEFDWTRDVMHNTYEICRDGVTPEKENLQNVPIEVVALWVDIFQN